MFMVLSSWHSHCQSSPGSFDECRLSAGWPPTLRPNQPIWTVSPLPSADTIAIYYYCSARKMILILPSHGGWKAESTYALHCTPCLLTMCSQQLNDWFNMVFTCSIFTFGLLYTMKQQLVFNYTINNTLHITSLTTRRVRTEIWLWFSRLFQDEITFSPDFSRHFVNKTLQNWLLNAEICYTMYSSILTTELASNFWTLNFRCLVS